MASTDSSIKVLFVGSSVLAALATSNGRKLFSVSLVGWDEMTGRANKPQASEHRRNARKNPRDDRNPKL